MTKKTKKSALPAGRQAKKTSTKASVKKVSRKAKVTQKPQTMEELLAQTGYKLRGLTRGETVEGTVTEKTKRAIFIDFGSKTEGMVIDRELKAAQDLVDEIKVGDKVEAFVTQAENEQGQILLSLRKAAQDRGWRGLEEKLKTEETVEVVGREVNKGGLIVEAKGLQGFIPASQFGSKLAGKVENLIGRILKVRPIEVDRAMNRLIFSEKEVSEAKMITAKARALDKIKVGDVFRGEVTGVMPFGLFVKIVTAKTQKGAKDAEEVSLEGLVHISEISWEKVEDPASFYKEKDKVKVKVLSVDKKSGKLNFSIKQLTPDPWEGIEKKYKVEGRVKGRVARIAPFGAFINLEPGVDGLIHISKIPAESSLKVGDKVNCFIESIEPEARRMSLGLVLKEKPVGYK